MHLNEFINRDKLKKYTVVEPTPEEKVRESLPELEKQIKKLTGITVHLDCWSGTNTVKITDKTNENGKSIIDQANNRFINSFLSGFELAFWGGDIIEAKDGSDGKAKIFYIPKIFYTSKRGGQQGTDFLWQTITFHLDDCTWELGDPIK